MASTTNDTASNEEMQAKSTRGLRGVVSMSSEEDEDRKQKKKETKSNNNNKKRKNLTKKEMVKT